MHLSWDAITHRFLTERHLGSRKSHKIQFWSRRRKPQQQAQRWRERMRRKPQSSSTRRRHLSIRHTHAQTHTQECNYFFNYSYFMIEPLQHCHMQRRTRSLQFSRTICCRFALILRWLASLKFYPSLVVTFQKCS